MNVGVTEENTRQKSKKKQPKNCLFFQQGWQTELWGFGDNQLQHMELQLAASSL